MEGLDDISLDIDNVEHYLRGLFQLPVGLCIADTEDIVRTALGYDIADLRRAPDPACVKAFQYVARIEWARSGGTDEWRLMYALYRRDVSDASTRSKRVDEVERRPLLEMPMAVQRHARDYLARLVATAGGEWPMLRGLVGMTRRTLRRP